MLPRVKDQVRCDSRSAAQRAARAQGRAAGEWASVWLVRCLTVAAAAAQIPAVRSAAAVALSFFQDPEDPEDVAIAELQRLMCTDSSKCADAAPAADKARATDACTQSPARPLSLALPSLTGCGVARCVAAETCARRRCATSPSPRAACPPSSSGFATPRTTCAPSLPPPPLRQPTWHFQPTLNSRLFSLSPGGRL